MGRLALTIAMMFWTMEATGGGRGGVDSRGVAFVPIVLSLLVLAAHFLRGGPLWIAAAVLCLLGVLFIRRAWVARLMQGVLALAALEWIRTLVVLAMRRSARGEPFARMTLILGAVVAVTVISALLFETEPMRRLYRRDGAPADGRGAGSRTAGP